MEQCSTERAHCLQVGVGHITDNGPSQNFVRAAPTNRCRVKPEIAAYSVPENVILIDNRVFT